MYRLSSGVSLGGLPPAFMQLVKFSLENQQHSMKRTGFYPVQPLKKNRFGIRRFFPAPSGTAYHFLGY
jgi:hypothetical protein